MNKKLCFIGHKNVYKYNEIEKNFIILLKKKLKTAINVLQWEHMENLTN